MNLGYFSLGNGIQNRFAVVKQVRVVVLVMVAASLFAGVALATDGVLPVQVNSPLRGNYCFEAEGVGLGSELQSETLTIDANGTPVAAYLYWSGRYMGDQSGDDDVVVALNGGSPAAIVAEERNVASANYSDRHYYTYRSTNLVTAGSGLNLADQFTPFTLTVSGLRGDESHGVGIVFVYENSDTCAYGDVHLMYGLDSFHHRFSEPAGPNSQVTCVSFDAVDVPRTIDYQLFAGGVAGPDRPDAIWTKSGTGALPANYALIDLIDDPEATELINPLDGYEQNPLGEWDNHQAQIQVPAGHTYACIQLESVPDFAPEMLGTSAVWVNLVFKVNGVLPPETATPTFTPTFTPTAIPPTATSTPTEVVVTSTPTQVTATATSTPVETVVTFQTQTATSTPVPPNTVVVTSTSTATPTPSTTPSPTSTPTSTPTDVIVSATPTPTPTSTVPIRPTTSGQITVEATPELPSPTSTPTPSPTPSPTPFTSSPICESETDLQVNQAIVRDENQVTITINYWNNSQTELGDIYLIDTIPATMTIDPNFDHSPWQCDGQSCKMNIGTLSANQSAPHVGQAQLHLLISDAFLTGQSDALNHVIIFQEANGLQNRSICSSQSEATIQLPTALDIVDEPGSFEATDIIYLPMGSW
ncbi:MAG: hypothetical protein AAF702_24630 [Chloroflexota bacterium]